MKPASAADRSQELYERWLAEALGQKSFWGGDRRLLAERPDLASEPLAVRRAHAIALVLREMPIMPVVTGAYGGGSFVLGPPNCEPSPGRCATGPAIESKGRTRRCYARGATGWA